MTTKCPHCGAKDTAGPCFGEMTEGEYTLALHPRPQPLDTPAARLEAVRHMMTPGVDEQTGEEVPALISQDEGIALLESAPHAFDGVNREPPPTRLADVTREQVERERAASIDAWEFRLRDSLQWAMHVPKGKR